MVNQQSLISYKKGAVQRQKIYDESMGKLQVRSKKAMDTLTQARQAGASAAAQSYKDVLPGTSAQREAVRTGKLDTSELKEFAAEFGSTIRSMDSSLQGFVERSGAMGLDMGDATDTAGVMGKFAEADTQDRARMLSNLDKEIGKRKDIIKVKEGEVKIADKNRKIAKKIQKDTHADLVRERAKFKAMKKTNKGYDEQRKLVGRLVKENTANVKVVNFHKDEMERLTREIKKQQDLGKSDVKLQKELKDLHNQMNAEERKYGKIKREIMDEERRLGRALNEQEKKAILSMKEKNRQMQDYSRHIDDAAAKIGGTLKTAFVIGTAAIAALNYKLMAVVSSFQDFESQLVNANSIWQESNETLFEVSDSVVNFGLKFGVEMSNATSGLYQYASAGVEAAEAMQMLQHTLKLSMAVQGDHNTLSKLTTQTIMGFNMEFSQAEEVTDKFAHAINKSLIEWDDLASSIKFALPFFISTGQSLDQLLGGLQVLTNRALEAGIAGRGLRQALAEFTQHADDNSAAFRKMGIEIMTVEGNMKPLTEIALEFQSVMGDGVTDMEVMIALMEDLNVRGATAFVHLVQNADEFASAVDDLANSQGSAHEMAMVQQEQLKNQIQVVKTALMAPFLLSDKVGEEAGYLNQFAMEVHGIVDVVENLFIKNMADGSAELTKMGEIIRDFVIGALHQAKDVIQLLVHIIQQFAEQGHDMTGMLRVAAIPLKLVATLAKHMGDGFFEAIIAYKILNGLIPMNTAILAANIGAIMNMTAATTAEVSVKEFQIMSSGQMMVVKKMESGVWVDSIGIQISAKNAQIAEAMSKDMQTRSTALLTTSVGSLMRAQIASKLIMFASMFLIQKYAKDNWVLAGIFGAVAGAAMSYAIALQMVAAGLLEVKAGGTLMGIHGTRILGWGILAGAAFGIMMQQMMKPTNIPKPEFDPMPIETMDTGGRFMARRNYDMGGYTQEHGLAMLQKGETVISKTQNMLGGASGGITLNIHGDVYDGENFAQKISEVLPMALRNTNDIGGI
jgi:TP901 family phage tail tape measure protein